MNRRVHWLSLVPLILAVAGFSRPPPKPAKGEHQPPMLPRLELLRAVGAGYIPLLADYFWVQTSQAIGLASDAEGFRDVYDYANLVTDLDPHYRQAYVLAGAAIPFDLGRGKYANTRESTLILEKGYRNVSDHIFVRILLAYNLSAYHGDYDRAAKILAETSGMKGAPPYLRGLATRMFAQAKDFDSGLALAQSLYDEADDEDSKKACGERVQALKLERALTEAEQACSQFKQKQGRTASGLAELVSSGELSQLPVDPYGGDIVLDESCVAHSSAQQERLKLFQMEKEQP